MGSSNRRQFLGIVGTGVTLGLAGCSGSSDDGGTTTAESTPGPHTPSEPQGNASVATSATTTGSSSVTSLTSPVTANVAGDSFETVTVDYDDGFDASSVEGEDVTVYVGEQLGSAQTATVTDATVTDDGTRLELTLDGSVTLADGQQVVVEYDGVRLPARPGRYAVTVTVNETASNTGVVEVTDTAGRISSDFETTIEGWRIQGDAQGGSTFPNHEDSGGNPGRCLSAVDDVQGGVWYWVAPAQFTGGKAAYLGGQLTFDIYQNNRSSQFSARDVVISNGETDLVYDFGGVDSHPETDWTSYTVPLAAGDGWTTGSISGEAATETQFETVFEDVTKLAIRGEYVSGPDTGYLDNPALVPPES